MKQFFTALLIFTATTALSQYPVYYFQQRFSYMSGSSRTYDVMQTADQNYLAVNGGQPDPFLVKFNEYGDTIWMKHYTGTFLNDFNCALRLSSGGFMVGGSASPVSTIHNLELMQIDSAGIPLWARTYTNPQPQSMLAMIKTFDGGFLTSGCFTFQSPPSTDGSLMQVNASGGLVWAKSYHYNTKSVSFSHAIQTPDKGFLVVGGLTTATIGDILIMKTDSVGNLLWTKIIGGSTSFEIAYRIANSYDGNFVICGIINQTTTGGAFDGFLMKIDTSGTTLWMKKYSYAIDDRIYNLITTPDGKIMFTGSSGKPTQSDPMHYFAKTDAAGNSPYGWIWGGHYVSHGYSICHSSNGGYIIGGQYSTTSSNVFGCITKLDSSGYTCGADSVFHTVTNLVLPDTLISLTVTNMQPVIANDSITVTRGVTRTIICNEIIDGVEQITNNEILSIYPNPSTGQVSIETSIAFSGSRLCITDITGKIVYINDRFAEKKFSLNLPNGFYFLTLSDSEHQITRKIIIR